MEKLQLIATTAFGLEAIVKREAEKLGFVILETENGRVTFEGNLKNIITANLWFRAADRVLLKMGQFNAITYDSLFEQTKALPWEKWIPQDGNFSVSGVSVKSKLYSVPDLQSIVEKAIVEKLKLAYKVSWFEKTGASYPIKINLRNDQALLTIDTSGIGLHKRGYRAKSVEAPLKETLAAAMVLMSIYKKDRILVDPFCGSGTIPIEAALIAKNIAPGLSRKFACEQWSNIPETMWKQARKEAFSKIDVEAKLNIQAYDIDKNAISIAKENAIEAGVEDCIDFQIKNFKDFQTEEKYGMIICNPPYGERIGDRASMDKIYFDLKKFYEKNATWMLYLFSADKDFEYKFSQKKADKKRKLYNGRIETTFYQYFGSKPDKLNGLNR